MPSVNCSMPLSINVCDIPLTNFQCGRQYENEHQELDWQDLLMICSWKLRWLHCTCTEHERFYSNLLSLDELKHLISAYKSAVTRIINSYFDEYTILLVLSSRAACQHVVLDPMHRNLRGLAGRFFFRLCTDTDACEHHLSDKLFHWIVSQLCSVGPPSSHCISLSCLQSQSRNSMFNLCGETLQTEGHVCLWPCVCVCVPL